MYVDRGDAQGLSSGSFQFLAAGLKRKKQQKVLKKSDQKNSLGENGVLDVK